MEYCHQKKEDPLLDIFWIDATSQNSVTSAFISISGLLSTATDQMLDNNARIAFVSRRFASWPTGLLLVFDNYDNPHEFPNIRDFFPPNKLNSILVTGRHADIGTLVLGQGANLIELSGLEEIAAVDLLQHHSQVIETNSKFGKEIVKRLGYHPLAITQAGTYIRKGGIPLCDFLDIYKQEKEEILKNTPQLSQYRRKLGDAENETSLNVFTTWQLSFQQLLSQTSEDSVTVKLLRLLAFFDNNDISEWIFIEFHRNLFSSKTSELLEWVHRFTDSQQGWKSRLFKKELILLHDFCLLQSVTQDSDEYSHASLHPLVKDWIQLQMGKPACQQFALMATQILGDILVAFQEREHFQLPLQTKQYLALHIVPQEDNNSEYLGIHCAELHQDLIVEYIKNQSLFATFCRTLGLHNKAELLQVQVMETRKKVLGAEHPDTLTSISNLASTYQNQGRWKEAELLQVQVMETRKKVLGAEHPSTLTIISNLALTYQDQGRWEEAEMLKVQVMETRKRVLGAEHPDTLTSINNLALTYQDQGRWEEAELLQVQVIETSKKVLGAEHPDTLISMNNVAFTWKQRGRHLEALELMEECVRLRTRILGNSHPKTLSSSATLLEWQTENLEISGLVEESPKEEGGKEEQRQDEMKVII
jgi:tetratricopeptide (TPR) repeat protein